MNEPALKARDDLASVKRYSPEEVTAPIKLDTNESPFAPPPQVLDRIKEELSSAELNRYPDREGMLLRAKIAEHNSWPEEGVWVANGSNEVFLHLFLAFGGPGRTALMFEPTFPLHSALARVTGTQVDQRMRSDDFLIGVDEALDAIESEAPEIVIACSPNNPTGGCEPLPAIATLVEAAPGIVVVDEAYIEFAGAGDSARELLDEHPNLVVVKTLSKAWSLAGVRLGYLLAAPELVKEMEVIRVPYHLSAITQAAGAAALDRASLLQATVDSVAAERDRLAIALQAMGLFTYPSRANFVLFRVDDADAVWRGLVDRGVLIRNFNSDAGLEGCLRVSAGLPEENDSFLHALEEVLDG